MQPSRKNLKISATVVLLLAILSLIDLLTSLWLGGSDEALAGMDESVLLVAKALVLVISLLLLMPQVYIGIKGIRIAKNPSPCKAHITWATVLLVFSCIGFLSPLLSILQQDRVQENIADLFSMLVDVVVLFEYIRYAKAVRKEYNAAAVADAIVSNIDKGI